MQAIWYGQRARDGPACKVDLGLFAYTFDIVSPVGGIFATTKQLAKEV